MKAQAHIDPQAIAPGPGGTGDPARAAAKRPAHLLARRVAAYAADCLLLFLVLAPLGWIVQRMLGYVPRSGVELWLTILAGFSLPTWLYFIAADVSAAGATVGKRWMGIRVRTDAGTALSPLRALARTAIRLLPWELIHLFAFALSTGSDYLSPLQAVGIAAASLLSLAYVGAAARSGGRRSVHDHAVSTHILSFGPEHGAR